MSSAKTLLIVYHSLTGGTRQMAEGARAGAVAEAGCAVRLLHAAQAGPADVLAADGYVFATPENLAAMSGQLKDFFDRSYYAVLDQVNGRPYASLVCAGSGGSNAPRQIARKRPRPFGRPSRSAMQTWRTAGRWARRWRPGWRWGCFSCY